MDKITEHKFEEMVNEFKSRTSQIQSEIASLDKSLNAVKESISNRFEEVKRQMIEDSKVAFDIIKSIRFSHFVDYNGIYSGDTSYECKSNSLENGKEKTDTFYISYEERSNYSYKFLKVHSPSAPDLYLHTEVMSYTDFFEKKSLDYITEKQNYIKYFENQFYTDLITITKKAIDIKLEHDEKILKDRKAAFANIESISETKENHWSEYIMYLLKWSSEHADKEFAGMSPACYDEWLDNERGEE